MTGKRGWTLDLAVVIFMLERLIAVSCFDSFDFSILAETFL